MHETKSDVYDVLVIGAGVTGTAMAYALSFTNIRKAIVLEKNEDVALVNSNTVNNAQTLHGGDTETNFSLEKALNMRKAEKLIAAFLERFGKGAFMRLYKMAFGVGEKEVQILRVRFETFKQYYPTLQFLERKDIEAVEPILLAGRDPKVPVAALYREGGYAVDYYKLAQCFMNEAKKSDKIEFSFNTATKKIVRKDDIYEVHTNKGVYRCHVLVAAAGPYSLLFAHSLGYAKEYVILPVAGSFYKAKRMVKGKVYPVQNPKFPFARVHADPAMHYSSEMRLGPPAKVVPMFERHHWATIIDFMRSGLLSWRGIRSIINIFCDLDMIWFAWKNFIYDIPVIGKRSFLKAARNIIPTLKYSDLTLIKGAGGIRPQLVNTKTGELEMGTGKFLGYKSIFNITPSPGASDSMRDAVIDVKYSMEFRGPGFKFDEEAFNKALGLSGPID